MVREMVRYLKQTFPIDDSAMVLRIFGLIWRKALE